MITTKASVSSLQATMQSCNKGMLSEIVYMLQAIAHQPLTGNTTSLQIPLLQNMVSSFVKISRQQRPLQDVTVQAVYIE
jgi:hypothetical protein